jgi:hypothetical protein
MKFPWSRANRELTPEERVERTRETRLQRWRRELYEPQRAAREIMRARHPALVQAEAALTEAAGRRTVAIDQAAELERRARALAAGVATGKATAAQTESAIVAARAAALALRSFDAAVAKACAAVRTEEGKALDGIAASLRARRLEISARVAKVVPVLEAALREEREICAEVRRLRSLGDRPLLERRDQGDQAEWPTCPGWRVAVANGGLTAEQVRRAYHPDPKPGPGTAA